MPNSQSKMRTYYMFAIVVLTCAIGSLTQTVMNSMLGEIGADFNTPDTVGQWLTTIFMLCIGITVPLVAHLSRKMSIRQLMLTSLGFFIVGAVIDWFAPNFWILMLGRIPQAVGTGITLPLLQTIAMSRFPREQNGTAMGIAGIAMGFAPNIGPLIGGALADSLGWRSFFIMLTIVLAVLIVLTLVLVEKEEASSHDARLDVVSFLLSTFGFGGILIAFTNAASMSIGSPLVWAPAIIGAVLIVVFVRRQNSIELPLISMGIFRSKTYVVSFIAQNCLFASFMGITLVIPVFVQTICGLSAFDAGIVFIPPTILAVVLNPVAGMLTDKIGSRPVVMIGSLFLSIGAISMVFVDASTPLWLLTAMQTVRGMGVSILIGPLISWGMKDLPPQLMVDGSAFFTTVRQVCASLGTALMMLLVSMYALTSMSAFGFQLAFALSAVFSCCVLLLAVFKVK